MTIQLLSKEGRSKLFIEEFDQYLIQSATCSGCHNTGVMSATFEVEDAANFILRDGSVQGLTQIATTPGTVQQNTMAATISVSGAGLCKYISRPTNNKSKQ